MLENSKKQGWASGVGEGCRGGGDLLVNVVEEAGGGLPHDFGI